jgi:hypothetical protein
VNAQAVRPALEAVDHLLLGVNDLQHGMAWFRKKTGVEAAVGGAHPGRGTHNALAALGGRHYLEIIAPDPAQPPDNLRMKLRELDEPRLITWAAATTDIDGLAKRIAAQGHIDAVPQDGSRSRPDGGVLQWRTLALSSELARPPIGPVPFFIEWAAGSAHPSQDAPKGCGLTAFRLEHPAAADLHAALAALGIEAVVRRAVDVRLIATLTTPKGEVELT